MLFSRLIVCLTILAASAVHAGAASNTGSGDPRCPADFDPLKSCPSSMILPGGAGFDTTRNIDPTSCNDQENCPRCLGDDAWQHKMINEIGLYSAVRDANFKPWVHVDNWLSSEIVSTITMLLLRDAMNISARAATMYTNGNMDYICCSEPILNVEQWSTGGNYLTDTEINTVTTVPNGYTGQSGLFVPPYTLEKYPLAFTYQAYRLLPDYQHIFPSSFSTACNNMTVDDTKGCVSGNYVCDTNVWANTTCYDGQWYVPPQCNVAGEVGNSSATHCQEVWMADPTYDSGYFEGMIKNNGLNMTGAYLGVVRHNAKVREAVARKEDILFYWYYPDPLIAEVNAQVVEFPAVTEACSADRTNDPATNTAKCGYPLQVLEKRVRTDALVQNPDFGHFFNSLQFSLAEVNALLTQHKSAGGNYSVYDLSCNWLKNNFDTWKGVVQNTPPTAANSISTSSTLVTVVAVLCVGVAVGVAVLVLWICYRKRLSLKNAPRTAPLALIFTDIENSTMLWEACGDDMGTAVEIHHAIIRKHIEEFNAYEVKTIGDCFMIACGSLGDATMLCLAIQTSLGECKDLPPPLRYKANCASTVTPSESTQPLTPLSSSPRARSVVITSPDDDRRSVHHSRRSHASMEMAQMEALDIEPMPSTTTNLRGEFYYPLRVRIGLHWCKEINPRMDAIHGRYDYYGHDVNVCARVEAQAQGGQILVTAETMEAIIETDEYPLMIAPGITSGIYKRNVELKGVSVRALLYGMAPKALVSSGYTSAKLLREGSVARRSVAVSSVFGNSLMLENSGVAGELEGGEASNNQPSSSGGGGGGMVSTRQLNACKGFSVSVLRAAFRSVPDSAKAAWIQTFAATLKLNIREGSQSSGGATSTVATGFNRLKAAIETAFVSSAVEPFTHQAPAAVVRLQSVCEVGNSKSKFTDAFAENSVNIPSIASEETA